MIPSPEISLDSRDVLQIVADLLVRQRGYVPDWQPSDKGKGVAIEQAFARYLQAILHRLNQAPNKNELAFFDLLGIELVPAQEARAPVVFQLSEQSPDTSVPAGTRIAAPPPPEGKDQILFETERATGVAAAKLREVVSLWAGRDQYIDHSAAFLAGTAFQLFLKSQLIDTPHSLYLAHDKLLALTGKSNVEVEFELTTPSSEPLDTAWEYWDGKVWRPFLAMRPSCDQAEAFKIDGTSGFTRSGKWRLEADCAQTSQTTVNGVNAYWIRARLTETLPPNPARILPEVETIRISTEIASPLELTVARPILKPRTDVYNLKVRVQDQGGNPLKGAIIQVFPTPSESLPADNTTDEKGQVYFDVTYDAMEEKTVSVAFSTLDQTIKLVTADSSSTYEVTFTLKGLGLDKAFSDGNAVDVSKPFYPLGLQPQPGSAFYFTNAEIFGKPGAKFRIYLHRTQTPQDQLDVAVVPSGGTGGGGSGTGGGTGNQTVKQDLFHALSWEYWNGEEWTSLLSYANNPNPTSAQSPNDFSGTGFIDDFVVPDDWAPTKVNNQDGLWMRVRLLSGSFGFTQTVTWQDSKGIPNQFTYVVAKPPALSDFRLGYAWQYGPFHAETVFSYDDFQYQDDTVAAKWPGKTFQPFKPVSDVTPALYLGFDKALPEDRLGIYFDIVEVRGDTQGPALKWEYWDGIAWQEIVVEDETHGFRVPGLVSFIAPEDSAAFARFDTSLYWLRARLREDGEPGEPTVNGIFANAVWAVQQQTMVEETLGKSTGQPDQVLTFRQFPVLSGERIEVQELSGARANVEWRIVAREVTGGDAKTIERLETQLAEEGAQTDIVQGDLHLRRDRNKRVSEVWVRWYGQPNLFFSGPNDRHYVLDRVRGRLLFGDGDQGKIPPINALVVARQYRTGGGLAGNVAQGTIKQLLSGIAGIQGVFNPRAAEGGANTETLAAFSDRAPHTLRHRGRAISPDDFETLAKEASPAVAVARAISCQDAGGNRVPGWVTLVILPQSDEPRPYPSFGLREEVRRFVEQRAAGDLAAAHHIYVTGPDYFPIDVEATIVPLDPAEAGTVEQSVVAALQTFFHPLRGGPGGRGWDLGRDVYISDVAAVLGGVAGVDYVKELALLLKGELQGDQIKVAAERIVVAGDLRIKMLQVEA